MPPTVREATEDDSLGVRSVIDAAMLELDDETLDRRVDAGTVLVAVDERRVVGALVAVRRDEGAHVEAVAVRRGRRDQGIGRALVGAARDRWGRLTAAFDPHVRPFYESVGFDVEATGDDRYRGALEE